MVSGDLYFSANPFPTKTLLATDVAIKSLPDQSIVLTSKTKQKKKFYDFQIIKMQAQSGLDPLARSKRLNPFKGFKAINLNFNKEFLLGRATPCYKKTKYSQNPVLKSGKSKILSFLIIGFFLGLHGHILTTGNLS